MSKKQNQQSSSKKGFAPFRWISRAFMGASRQYAEETLQQQEENRINDVEEIVSPGRQLVRNFMERKLAVFALCVVIAMFLFVFIGPLFLTNYSDSYTEVTQKSVPPTMSMMSVPRELRDDIKMIDANGSFTVGLSNAGKVYVWGATQIGTTGVNVANIPDEVKNTKIAMVAAGIDHIVAIGENGKVYAWGNNKLGQYGRTQEMIDNPNIAVMPEEIMVEGGIDVANVKKLTCGYQCSAILMNDGTLYMWGNKLTYANIDKFLDNHGLKDVAFLLNYIVGIKEEGTSVYTGTRGLYGTLRTNVYAQSQKTKDFLDGRTIERIVATSDTLCLELSDGSIALSGDFTSDCVEIPELEEDEHFLIGSISAGTYHYTGITNKGHVYSWGKNHFGQSNAPAKVQGAAQVFTGSFQNYAVDENGKLLGTWGLKGYLFGTDTYGADIFQRICAGGKMTMTIGAVAVIFSTIIGIIIGCLSGYFGGKVDMLMQRFLEVANGIPRLVIVTLLLLVLQPGMITIIFALMLTEWVGMSRIARAEMLKLKDQEFVLASRTLGAGSFFIIFKEVLPNIIGPIITQVMFSIPTAIFTEAFLSFVGLGIPVPQCSLGSLISELYNSFTTHPYQIIPPIVVMSLLMLSFNLLADGLREALDPKMKSM